MANNIVRVCIYDIFIVPVLSSVLVIHSLYHVVITAVTIRIILYTTVSEISGGSCDAGFASHTASIGSTPSNGSKCSTVGLAPGTNTPNLYAQKEQCNINIVRYRWPSAVSAPKRVLDVLFCVVCAPHGT